jgi:hypothetical protein
MATQPKPKPKPEPEPPEPKPDDDDAARHYGDPPQTDTNASSNSLTDRLDALFTSHVALIERVEKLEERVNAPPIGLGKRP